MISFKNVTKYYPMRDGERHYVLRDVSFEIPSRESVAIIGPNGAGKSTLLRLIGGAEAPNEGSIVTKSNISWPIGLSSGFQGSMTGRQNIHFVCQINGLSEAETQEVIDAILDFSELEEYFDMPIKSYSSGMRARLGFGLSINFEFDYYLVDELTAVGDIIFKEKAKKEFVKITKNASLLYASHKLNSLKDSCKSAIFLRDGILDYFKDVDDGIKAYEDYIGHNSTTKIQKTSKRAVKKAAKKSVRKRPRKTAKNLEEKPARKLTSKTAATPAQKAARKKVKMAIKRIARTTTRDMPTNQDESK